MLYNMSSKVVDGNHSFSFCTKLTLSYIYCSIGLLQHTLGWYIFISLLLFRRYLNLSYCCLFILFSLNIETIVFCFYYILFLYVFEASTFYLSTYIHILKKVSIIYQLQTNNTYKILVKFHHDILYFFLSLVFSSICYLFSSSKPI